MNKKKNLTTKETFALAVQHHQKNNLQVAEKLYREILKTNPNHANTRNNLGSVLKELGESQKAISCFQKAIEIQSNHAGAYYNLGIVFNELGELQKAISCFQKTIGIQSNHVGAYYNLGNAFRELEESKKAIGYYEKAIQINPNHTYAYNNLGNVFKDLGEHKKAISYFQKTNSIVSKEELLKYSYLLDGLEDYKKKLEKFIKKETCNRNVAAMAAYVSKKENIKNIYPFCKDPLNFVFINNLKNVSTLTDNFTENLLERLEKVHSVWEPKTTTTKRGYQTSSNLFNSTDIEILKLQKIIEKQIITYRKVYELSEDYFIKKWPRKYKFSAWYVKLLKQGHQKPHMHAQGWLSGVFYIKVPKLLNKYEGSIKFLLSSYDFPEDKNLPNLIHSPNDFDLVLFPSSLIHQTIPFNSLDGRHSIAFDLIPK
jgi:tetratricopeptide (TPR) repeat protein